MTRTEAESEEHVNGCGWLHFRPRALQRFMKPQFFLFCVCIGSSMQGFIINGLINVNITSLERRFSLSSFQTGLIAGTYDIAATIFSIPIAYFGGRVSVSKPKWVGVGLLVMGMGSFIFSTPHFLTERFRGGPAGETTLCVRNTSEAATSGDCNPDHPLGVMSVSNYLYVFLLAQFLHGIGAAPLWSLVVAYIEANVKKQLVSMYLAIYYAMALIGPALGYLGGSLLLQIHTELGFVDTDKLNLNPGSENWVGAWWVGFFVAAFLTWAAALPVLAFPPSLPSSRDLVSDTSETHGHKDVDEQARVDSKMAQAKMKDLPFAVWQCLTNPTFLFMALGGGTNGAVLSGISTFMPKIMESQLAISASLAGLYTGATALIGGVTGSLLGGYLVKRFDMSCTTIIQLVAASTFCTLLCSLVFFISCPNVNLAGVNVPYPQQTPPLTGEERFALIDFNLTNPCNSECSCGGHDFMPVCGPEGVTYFSPCHAGCIQYTEESYRQCSCVEDFSRPSSDEQETVIEGRCSTNCNYLPLLAIILICTAFTIFLGTSPSSTAIVRSVTPGQRSLAMGISMTLLRVVGTIPGPIVYGALLDRSCTLWRQNCGERGSCLLYDHWWMSRYVLMLTTGFVFLSCICFNLAWFLYRPLVSSTIKINKTENAMADVALRNLGSEGKQNYGFQAE